MTIKEFFEHYNNALRSKFEKKSEDEFKSFTTWIQCVTHFEIEKQFESVHTNSMFKEFQRELIEKLYYEVTSVEGKNELFDIVEDRVVGDA